MLTCFATLPTKRFTMSFGFSISDIISLIQLGYKTADNAKHACGEYNDIIDEVVIAHSLLRRLRDEMLAPHSLIGGDTNSKQDLTIIMAYCARQEKELEWMIQKFSGLSAGKGGVGQLWQKMRFGNGKMQDLADIRTKLANCYITLTLTVVLAGSQSRAKVEESGSVMESKAL
jgi:hypothetical protein